MIHPDIREISPSIAITIDNKYIVSCGDKSSVVVWDFQDRIKKVALSGNLTVFRSVSITIDNKYLALVGMTCVLE